MLHLRDGQNRGAAAALPSPEIETLGFATKQPGHRCDHRGSLPGRSPQHFARLCRTLPNRKRSGWSWIRQASGRKRKKPAPLQGGWRLTFDVLVQRDDARHQPLVPHFVDLTLEEFDIFLDEVGEPSLLE